VSVLLASIAIISGSVSVITVAALRFAKQVLEREHQLDAEPERLAHERELAAAQAARDAGHIARAAEEDAKRKQEEHDAALARVRVSEELTAKVFAYKPIKTDWASLTECPLCGRESAQITADGKEYQGRPRAGGYAWGQLVDAYVKYGALAVSTFVEKERQCVRGHPSVFGPSTILVLRSGERSLRWQICFTCGGDWVINPNYIEDGLKDAATPKPKEPKPKEPKSK
jgi:hypothetical protein